MQNDEQVKSMVDEFGKLSFLLESFVKLYQTKDCKELNKHVINEAHRSCASLLNQIEDLNPLKDE